MKKNFTITFLFLFFIVGINSTFALNNIQTECKMQYSSDQSSYDGHYRVLRDGDSLFANYRHQPSRDFTATDDVTFKLYEGEALLQYNRNGLVDKIAEAARVDISRIAKLLYFGIDQDDSTLKFEMQVWRLQGTLGERLAAVASSNNEWFVKCSN